MTYSWHSLKGLYVIPEKCYNSKEYIYFFRYWIFFWMMNLWLGLYLQNISPTYNKIPGLYQLNRSCLIRKIILVNPFLIKKFLYLYSLNWLNIKSSFRDKHNRKFGERVFTEAEFETPICLIIEKFRIL